MRALHGPADRRDDLLLREEPLPAPEEVVERQRRVLHQTLHASPSVRQRPDCRLRPMDETGEARRIPLVWLLAPVAVMTALGYLGDILGPKLINDQPLLQIFLNPKNRWLLLASPQVDVIPFFLVGFTRLVLTDPLAFVLGRPVRRRGDRLGREADGRLGRLGPQDRARLRRVAPLVILVAPSFNWCVLAGANRMRVRVFVTLNLIGTVARLALFRMAGDAFRDEIQDVLERRAALPVVAGRPVVPRRRRHGHALRRHRDARGAGRGDRGARGSTLVEGDDVPEETAPREP